MPHYEYECQKCQHVYDIWSTITDKPNLVKKTKCPRCNSKKKEEILGSTSFAFANPIGSDRWSNSHDYRYHHTIDKPGGVRDQRKNAQEKSHMGSDPYKKYNDLNRDQNWGEVK